MSPTFAPISAGGVGNAKVTSTSGSPTVNNNSRPGRTVYEFNGSGSITIGTAGYAEIAIISGGGVAMSNWHGGGGGGGGGVHVDTNYMFATGTHTITVGAGGSGPSSPDYTSVSYPGGGWPYYASRPGSLSAIGNTRVFGGGGSRTIGGPQPPQISGYQVYGVTNGGGGGGASVFSLDSNALLGVGYNGGSTGVNTAGSGGGGAGGPGNSTSGTNTNRVAGNGGEGKTVNITGVAVTYGGGGGGWGGNNLPAGGSGGGGNGNYSGGNGNAGAANTGGGGGGANAPDVSNQVSGGSGKVIVVV